MCRTAYLVCCCVALSACAADSIPGANLLAGGKRPESAQLTITRTRNQLYATEPATVEVNGMIVAEIVNGATVTIAIPAGDATLVAYATKYPGKYSVRIRADAGRTYAAEVTPRRDSYLPVFALGEFGASLDASLNSNAGAFRLRMVSAGMAS